MHIHCTVKCCRNKHLGCNRQDWETVVCVHNLFSGNKEPIVEVITESFQQMDAVKKTYFEGKMIPQRVTLTKQNNKTYLSSGIISH